MTTPFRLAALAAILSATAGMAWAGGKAPPEPTPPPVAARPADDKAPEAPARPQLVHQGPALLQMFQTFCRDTHAGAGAVIAAAERDGYRATDANDLKAYASMEMRDLQVRARTVGGVRRLVGSGHGRYSRLEGRPAMDICIVSISPGGEDAAGAFGQWLGMEPFAREQDYRSVFMFLEGPQGRVSIDTAGTPSALRRRMRDGDLQLLTVDEDEESTTAIYGVMRPEI